METESRNKVSHFPEAEMEDERGTHSIWFIAQSVSDNFLGRGPYL